MAEHVWMKRHSKALSSLVSILRTLDDDPTRLARRDEHTSPLTAALPVNGLTITAGACVAGTPNDPS